MGPLGECRKAGPSGADQAPLGPQGALALQVEPRPTAGEWERGARALPPPWTGQPPRLGPLVAQGLGGAEACLVSLCFAGTQACPLWAPAPGLWALLGGRNCSPRPSHIGKRLGWGGGMKTLPLT